MRKLKFDNTDSENKSDRTNQETTATPTKPKCLLESFEHIVELAQDSNLNEEFEKKASIYIKYASRKLHLSAIQTVLLALFVDRSENSRIMMSEIAEYTGCRTTKILRLADDIDVLEQKYYLRASRSNRSLSYRVPAKVLDSLRKNQPYKHKLEPVTDLQSFFDRFNSLMEEKNDDEVTYDSLLDQTDDAIEEIKDTAFAIRLKRLHLNENDRLLFIFMAHLFVENDDDDIRFNDIDDLYDDNKIPSWCKHELRTRTSGLFAHDLIENVNEDGMARSDSFKLTDKAKDELLGELNLNKIGKSQKGLISHDSLAEKKLIYNDTEHGQIDELSSILSADRFSEVQSRLRKAGMRPGFCCIFYGAPGTGKTETVYQLARRTGRNILRVDVDKIKSCWVGESEKNIKSLFDRYRNICNESPLPHTAIQRGRCRAWCTHGRGFKSRG